MKRALFILLSALLLCLLAVSAPAENSNFVSSGGWFAYKDGYMYFVGKDWTSKNLNDGRETGYPDSVEFWRIADQPGAQKELLASLPAAQIGGVALDPGYSLVPMDGALWFVREWPGEPHEFKDQLCRLDLASGNAEILERILSSLAYSSTNYVSIPFFLDGDQIYFLAYSGEAITLDTRTKEISPWTPQFGLESGRNRISFSRRFGPGYILEIKDGYFYYVDTDPLANDPMDNRYYCIFRRPVSGGDRELVIPRLADYGEADFAFVQGDMIFLFNGEKMFCVDLASKQAVDQVAMDQVTHISNQYGATLNVEDGKVYFLKTDGLYVKTIGADDETLLISGDTEGFEGLALGENYFYLRRSDRVLFRVPRSARFFQEAEILLKEEPEPEPQEEDGWKFIEYENCVTVEDYVGEESTVQAPAVIHGKPVIRVSLDPYSKTNQVVRALTIPEGVIRLGVIGGDNLTDLWLPSSLEYMSNDGYPRVFATTDGCVIRYAGTRAEWQALDDRSWSDYASWNFKDLTGLRVLCSDGEWFQPGTTPAPAPDEPEDELISGDNPGDYTEVWAHTWYRPDEPETQLIITPNGDGMLRMEMYFYRMVGGIEVYFEPIDYVCIQFEDTMGDFSGIMYFDPKQDNYLHLLMDTFSWNEDDPFHQYFQNEILFTADDMPDLSRYVWDFVDGSDYEEGDWYVSEEECAQLFNTLSRYPLIACSGAGAWAGELHVLPDGRFTGYYYDSDADVVYEVSFSGEFIPSGTERCGENVYGLWVENLTTQQAPGTEAVSTYGDRIVYNESPIADRSYLRLTLPGAPDDEIPELVQGEIGGTYDVWSDYSRFITLTGDDGWGFFADTENPESLNLEPIPAAHSEKPADDKATGYMRCEFDEITFEVPDDWTFIESDFDLHRYLPPSPLNETVYNQIILWSMPGETYEEMLSSLRQGSNSSTRAYALTIDGHSARVIEDIFEFETGRNRIDTLVYLRRDNGTDLYIELCTDSKYTSQIDPIYSHFLSSIRFTSGAAPAAPAVSFDGWTGDWMTHDDSYAEMIVTDGGNGTLHAQMMFLPAGDSNATLTPQADGSMRFETEYGNLSGVIVRQADGTLRLTVTGGYTMEDDEATEYQGYFARGFLYYPAEYKDMWYQTPEDAACTEADWLGNWTSMTASVPSTVRISRENGGLFMKITLGQYHFSGLLDLAGDTIAALYDDDFNCMLILNRKLQRIAVLEIGSNIDAIYDLTGGAYYGVVMYERAPDVVFQIPENNMPGGWQPVPVQPTDEPQSLENSVKIPEALLGEQDDIPPVTILPILPTDEPQSLESPIKIPEALLEQQDNIPPITILPILPTEEPEENRAALLPIQGKPGYMQVPVARVDATSYIVGQDPDAYAPFRMTDGDETTAFQFSTRTTPLGKEYLYFDFDSPVALDEMWMKNGFWRYTDGKDQYTRNCRVKNMTIALRYADGGDYWDLKTASLKDDGRQKEWKVIDLLGKNQVIGVRIRIDAVYSGTKFPNDVCISEIMFVQKQ
ncbi:MAG: hypothetical protein K5919_10735 [Clostridiales bacterium]|nr:hypothetical protein [Clostridiales bacterium]